MLFTCGQVVPDRSWFKFQEVMPDSLKKSVKCRVPVDGRGPIAFGTEWVKISLGEDSHESTRGQRRIRLLNS